MTQNPESATVEMAIVEALHIMHNGKFLHLPVLDKGSKIFQTLTMTNLSTCIVISAFGPNVNDFTQREMLSP